MTKKEYMSKYQLEHKDYFNNSAKKFYHENKISINERRRKNPFSLMSILKRNATKRNLLFRMEKEDFATWWKAQKQVCVYCDIPVERMTVVNKSKKLAKRLSIDRIVNEKGYTIDNIVLACMRCNFIKSNLFTFDEMREIGQKFIKPKWL